MEQEIYLNEDGSYLTESQVMDEVRASLSRIFNESITEFFNYDNRSKEDTEILKRVKDDFEDSDTKSFVMAISIALLAEKRIGEMFPQLTEETIYDSDPYHNIDIELDCRPVNDVKQNAYTQYINRMMKH